MKKRAFLYIILAGILWGTSGIFFNLLSPYGFTSLDMTIMRGVVAALGMSCYVFFTDKSLFRINIREFIIFALSGISVFFTATCYYEAMKASSVSTAVVLMYTSPVFVMTYSIMFFKERFSALKAISVIMMLAGCAFVSGIIGGIKFSLWGILMGFASALSYSAYNIFTKIGALKNYNSLSAALYCFIVMGTLSLFFIQPVRLISLTSASPAAIIPLIFGIGICTCVLPYLLYTIALKTIPAGTAVSLSIIEPMSATVFSVFFFKEQLSLLSIIGIILILSAVFLLSRSE